MQTCLWGFNMGEINIAKTISPQIWLSGGTYISTLKGPGSITCGQYLDRTLGKFPPIYGPHLKSLELQRVGNKNENRNRNMYNFFYTF